MSWDDKLKSLGWELPPAPKPAGVYQPLIVVERMAWVSGHGPLRTDGSLIVGCVGADLTEAEGYAAARAVGLTMLATLQRVLGTLDRIERIVKVLGMVRATPDFTRHPQVINGFSELMAELFGPDCGVAARSAVGMGSLPSGIAVEVEAAFLLHS